jgi:hypothetical protein
MTALCQITAVAIGIKRRHPDVADLIRRAGGR